MWPALAATVFKDRHKSGGGREPHLLTQGGAATPPSPRLQRHRLRWRRAGRRLRRLREDEDRGEWGEGGPAGRPGGGKQAHGCELPLENVEVFQKKGVSGSVCGGGVRS